MLGYFCSVYTFACLELPAPARRQPALLQRGGAHHRVPAGVLPVGDGRHHQAPHPGLQHAQRALRGTSDRRMRVRALLSNVRAHVNLSYTISSLLNLITLIQLTLNANDLVNRATKRIVTSSWMARWWTTSTFCCAATRSTAAR